MWVRECQPNVPNSYHFSCTRQKHERKTKKRPQIACRLQRRILGSCGAYYIVETIRNLEVRVDNDHEMTLNPPAICVKIHPILHLANSLYSPIISQGQYRRRQNDPTVASLAEQKAPFLRFKTFPIGNYLIYKECVCGRFFNFTLMMT